METPEPTVQRSASSFNRLRVGVLGARGKVGREICRALSMAHDLELVAELGRGDSLQALVAAGADVAVDFTEPRALTGNLRFLVEHGIHTVVGTTGFDESLLDEVRRWLEQRPDLAVLMAPNFALGAVLAMRFAEQAARFFDSVEVIEYHHRQKVDAPSGTALSTARRIATARSGAGLEASPDATSHTSDAARGVPVEGVRVHAVRLAGVVSRQEVMFGNPGEVLSIRHDSVDRSSFAPGVLLAIRKIRSRRGLILGLDDLLEF